MTAMMTERVCGRARRARMNGAPVHLSAVVNLDEPVARRSRS